MPPEIRAFEYAMGMFSVLIGLAVADVATSFHRLLRVRAAVRWDPLALLAACYALCTAISMWFDLWGVRNFAATRHFLFYIAMVVQFFLLFLLAAASLPDERDEGRDLRAFYATNHRQFWALLVLFQLVYVVFGIYFGGSEVGRTPLGLQILGFTLMCVPLFVSIVLWAVASRGVHLAGLVILYAVLFLHYGRAQIN